MTEYQLTHPLTHEICLEITNRPDMVRTRVADLQTAADWQLEQVIKWLKSQVDYPGTLYYELPTLDCESIECSLRHAMRPQEDN